MGEVVPVCDTSHPLKLMD